MSDEIDIPSFEELEKRIDTSLEGLGRALTADRLIRPAPSSPADQRVTSDMRRDIRQRLTAALESDEMLKDAFRMMGLLRLFHEGSPLFAEVAASVLPTVEKIVAAAKARQESPSALLPYSSPEARTRAGEALDAGRLSVHAHPSKRRQAPDFPAIDELLFNVGQNRERMNVEIEAAHALIPETLVPRNRGKTDERSIAERLRILLQIIDRRAAALLRPETDTPQPGDAA